MSFLTYQSFEVPNKSLDFQIGFSHIPTSINTIARAKLVVQVINYVQDEGFRDGFDIDLRHLCTKNFRGRAFMMYGLSDRSVARSSSGQPS